MLPTNVWGRRGRVRLGAMYPAPTVPTASFVTQAATLMSTSAPDQTLDAVASIGSQYYVPPHVAVRADGTVGATSAVANVLALIRASAEAEVQNAVARREATDVRVQVGAIAIAAAATSDPATALNQVAASCRRIRELYAARGLTGGGILPWVTSIEALVTEGRTALAPPSSGIPRFTPALQTTTAAAATSPESVALTPPNQVMPMLPRDPRAALDYADAVRDTVERGATSAETQQRATWTGVAVGVGVAAVVGLLAVGAVVAFR